MTGCTTLMTPTSSTKVQVVKIKPPAYLLDVPIEPELVPDNSSFSDVMKVHKRNALAWKQARDQLNYLIRWSKESTATD